MKISEVCRHTGLTERTVRFYIDKELIAPQAQERGGRIYHEYTEQDIERIRQVALLRKVGFSIADIRRMQADPGAVVPVLLGHEEMLREGMARQAGQLLMLERAKGARHDSIASLCAALGDEARALPLPKADAEPDFARLDDEPGTKQDRALAGQAFFAQKHQRQSRRRRMAALCAAVLVVAAAVGIGLWRDANQKLVSVLYLTDVTFQEKRAVSDEEYGFVVRMSYGGHAVEVPLDARDAVLYGSLHVGVPYSMATLQVELPRKTARSENLVDISGFVDAYRLQERLLADPSFMSSYARLIGVQGD